MKFLNIIIKQFQILRLPLWARIGTIDMAMVILSEPKLELELDH